MGRVAIAWMSPGVEMLEGRDDLAVLWNIRVAPECQRHGVATALFHAAEKWAVARGATRLKVETQNINVAACEFYARMGCVLDEVHRDAYPEYPDEIQLFWYKDVTGRS